MYLQLNRNSWHYNLAHFGAMGWYCPSGDICGYTREVLTGLGVALITLAAMYLVVGGTIDMIHCLITGELFSFFGTVMFFAYVLAIGIVCVIVTSATLVLGSMKVWKAAPKPKTDFISEAWEAFTDKTCKRIVWK